MSKRVRQYIGLICAVVSYYIIHEGAHLLVALFLGVFKRVNFLGLGVQVDVYAQGMTDTQMGIFCLVGAIATFLTAWALVLLCRRICAVKSKLFKTILWYTSICLLLLDPLYLSVLCGLFGGGDMNGIRLLLPEPVARIGFGILGIAGALVIWKYLLPEYTKAFQEKKHENE